MSPRISLLLSCCGSVGLACGPAIAGETILHSFAGGTDGGFPTAGVTVAGKLLFGTTPGDASTSGTAFKVTTAGTENVLNQFSPATGTQPAAGLLHLNGIYYGTTSQGGAYNGGTVFSMTPAGAITVLYSFGGSTADGSSPQAGLVAQNGVLYGTTSFGGVKNKGTVFSLTTTAPVTETVMHSFGEPGDGSIPEGGLLYADAKFWGTTKSGGNFNGVGCVTLGCGTVYSISPNGTYKMVYAFQGPGKSDGQGPEGNLVYVSGKLYGTTSAGGANFMGTVFSVTVGGSESVIHSFGGSSDGESPVAGLLYVNGLLYGTASYAGPNGNGTLFSLSTSGNFQLLYGFGAVANDGNGPCSNLSYSVSGSTYTFYGTTSSGGANCTNSGGCGTVFAYH